MSDTESGEEIIDEVEEAEDDAEAGDVLDNASDVESGDDESDTGSGASDDESRESDDDLISDIAETLDPREVKQRGDYPIVEIVLQPGQRRTNKDFLDQMETAQLVATFTQLISNHDYIPPINTEGYDEPRDIAIKAILERGLDRKKQTIPITIKRKLPRVVDRSKERIIQYVEYIDPNDPAIAMPFLPALRELSKAV